MSRILRTLIVENSQDDAQSLVNQLENWGYQIVYERVENLKAMTAALENARHWDLLFADHSIPEFSAQAALSILKEKQIDLPFIVFSGEITSDTSVFLMKYGVHDYIVKGELQRLDVVIQRELTEANIRKKHKKLLSDLEYLALHQPLTGLANQTLFRFILQQELKKPQQNQLFAVLYLDLDRFQTVKYSFGNSYSNQLIIVTVERLKKSLHPRHTLAHLSNDQFVILLKDLDHLEEALAITSLIHKIIACPFTLDGVTVSTTASIGIVFRDIGYTNPEDFLQAADNAMHHAKRLGKGQTVQFQKHMIAYAQERLKLETELLQGIKNREFCLNYQAIVSLKTGKVKGFEALVRWQHPTRGLMAPTKFIPIAEETGLITPLSEWIISEACRRLGAWQELFPKLSLQMSINLSSVQLSNVNVVDLLEKITNVNHIKTNGLKIEITESMLIENYDLTSNILTQLKKRNIQIAIDDFGTGYSCLNYLSSLPIDTLKIDRSFLKRDLKEPKNLALLKSIVSMAHNLGLDVVAEGIETEEEVSLLQSLDCEYGQGYLFSYPLNCDAAEALMRFIDDK